MGESCCISTGPRRRALWSEEDLADLHMGDAALGTCPPQSGSGLAAAVGQWSCHVFPSSSGLWTPVRGCECFHRMQHWLGTCPVPGDKWMLWHQGRMKWFCSCLSPHSPQLVLPCTGMFALVVTVFTLPLDVSLQATRMSQPSPVASTHLSGSRAGAGCRWEHREAVLSRG